MPLELGYLRHEVPGSRVACIALLRPQDGGLSPYQQSALTSLKQLTGRDTEPTAAAWRNLLAKANTEK
ncbi:MAG: hypothetical protein ACLPV4_16485 [Solirubrobacteraceae bacterium]